MAKKPVIATVPQTTSNTESINSNFSNIKESFDNTLSRDGSTPNQMNADIDLNSNDLLNVRNLNVSNLTVGGVDYETATNDIRSFEERSGLVTEWDSYNTTAKAAVVNGTLWSAEGLLYERDNTSTILPDLNGWSPAGVINSGHFASTSAAETYIASADTTGWEEQEVGKGFVRLPGRENVRRLEEKFGDVVDVRDFSGIDPTGSSSSLSAIQNAVTEWRTLVDAGSETTGLLYFPPNGVANGEYVIDGSVNLTSIRGYMNNIEAHGAVFRGVGAGNVTFDTTHSNLINWRGGQIIGDDTDTPAVGLQLARFKNGSENPSSHHHFFQNLTIDGHWTTGCVYNYASEANLFQGLQLRNQSPGMDRYCLVMDGQSGGFTPTSDYLTMGFGAYTGFAHNRFVNCSFWRTAVNGSGVSGPAIFMSRVEGHSYHTCLTQVRIAPTIVIHHVSGERGTYDLFMDLRAETDSSTALVYLTGDDGGVHRDIEIRLDRLFCQRVFNADSALTNGQTKLIDLDVRIPNIFPGAASSNASGYMQFFGDTTSRAKLGLVTGSIALGNRDVAETGYVNTSGLNIGDFRGRLKVSDRAQVGTLPTGEYRLEDDTGFPTEVTSDDTTTFSFAITDSQATPNVSATSVNAKVWRRGDRMYMVARDLNSIDVTGLTGTDLARVYLPRDVGSVFASGHTILGSLSSPPTGGAGTIDQIQIVPTLSADYVTFRLVDASGTAPNLTVNHFNGASIREFRFEWDV